MVKGFKAYFQSCTENTDAQQCWVESEKLILLEITNRFPKNELHLLGSNYFLISVTWNKRGKRQRLKLTQRLVLSRILKPLGLWHPCSFLSPSSLTQAPKQNPESCIISCILISTVICIFSSLTKVPATPPNSKSPSIVSTLFSPCLKWNMTVPWGHCFPCNSQVEAIQSVSGIGGRVFLLLIANAASKPLLPQP